VTARPRVVVLALRFVACVVVAGSLCLLLAVGPAITGYGTYGPEWPVIGDVAHDVPIASVAFVIVGAGWALLLGRRLGSAAASAGYPTAAATTAVASVASSVSSGPAAAVSLGAAVTCMVVAAPFAVLAARFGALLVTPPRRERASGIGSR